MKLSATEEYGLRCLVQLAREPGEFGTIQEIARREGLSAAYVAKIMGSLRKSGLVSASRGHKGGYTLARPADEIDLASVLEALGGRIVTDHFCQTHAGAGDRCRHHGNCSIRPVLVGLDRLVHDALSRVTLKALVRSEPAMHAYFQTRLESETALPGRRMR